MTKATGKVSKVSKKTTPSTTDDDVTNEDGAVGDNAGEEGEGDDVEEGEVTEDSDDDNASSQAGDDDAHSDQEDEFPAAEGENVFFIKFGCTISDLSEFDLIERSGQKRRCLLPKSPDPDEECCDFMWVQFWSLSHCLVAIGTDNVSVYARHVKLRISQGFQEFCLMLLFGRTFTILINVGNVVWFSSAGSVSNDVAKAGTFRTIRFPPLLRFQWDIDCRWFS